MPGPYQTLSVLGDRWPENRRMHVLLYPNSPTERSACAPGSTVAMALRSAAEQLFDAGAISYCRLLRFPAERIEHVYPRIDAEADIEAAFREYLRGTTDEFSESSWCATGECRDLTAFRGVHLLVHGHGFSTDLASAEGDGCEYGEGTGFSQGGLAWTSSDDGSGEGLTRNSAIQETLHLFVQSQLEEVQRLICDVDGDGEKSAYEEHTLGAIDRSGAVTPMLTYHVDEQAGCHHPDREWNGGYTPILTPQTKAAVYHTGKNQCRPQPGVPEDPRTR